MGGGACFCGEVISFKENTQSTTPGLTDLGDFKLSPIHQTFLEGYPPILWTAGNPGGGSAASSCMSSKFGLVHYLGDDKRQLPYIHMLLQF